MINLYKLLPLKFRPPIIAVEWHHLDEFRLERPALIWLRICNQGGDATLVTDGLMGSSELGQGEYPFHHGQVYQLGFYGDEYSPKITVDMMENSCIPYSVTLTATNRFGASSYRKTKYIPVQSFCPTLKKEGLRFFPPLKSKVFRT